MLRFMPIKEFTRTLARDCRRQVPLEVDVTYFQRRDSFGLTRSQADPPVTVPIAENPSYFQSSEDLRE